MTLLKRFYQYQEERFPIKILVFTTMAVVLSSAAILGFTVNIWQLLASFFACIFFLYHIRVIDESRDEQHDTKYHADRPVQRGLIRIRELFLIDIFALILFSAIMLSFGGVSLTYGLALLLFSFIAWKDFFLGERLKQRFLLYNSVNMFQMVLLQLFIYAVLTQDFYVDAVMWIHLLFVIFNTLILEFVRKIKTSDDESIGKDTYSWHLGYARSIYYFYGFTFLNLLTFIWMMYTLAPDVLPYVLIALGIQAVLTFATVWHLFLKKKTSEQFLLLATVVNYVGLNLLIYIYNA
ncbi:MAG: UbiA family prenyltransferase [Bacteroidales bacterium]|nr:UbiA family prenyltransferase [Bacteroidales bacterium]